MKQSVVKKKIRQALRTYLFFGIYVSVVLALPAAAFLIPQRAALIIFVFVFVVFYVFIVSVAVREILREWLWQPIPTYTRFTSVAALLYSPADMERVFNPILADWEKEYSDACDTGGISLPLIVGVRYRFRLALTIAIKGAYKIADLVF